MSLVRAFTLVGAMWGASVLSGCGNPTVKSSDAGTYVISPDGGRADGLGDLLRDGGLRPNRPPSSCTKVTQEIQLTGDPIGAAVAAIRWTGQFYIVAYVERDAPGDAKVMLLNGDGTLRSPAVALEVTPGQARVPFILAHGAGYVVAWEEVGSPSTVRARLLDANGVPSGPAVTVAPFASPEGRPVLASSSLGLTLAYMDLDGGRPASRVVALNPATLLPTGTPVLLGGSTMATSHPYILGDGTSLVAIFTEIKDNVHDVHFASLDGALASKKDVVLRTGPVNGILGRITKTNFGYFAMWEDGATGDNEIYGARMSPEGDVLSTHLLQEENSGDGNWSNMAWHDDVGAVTFYQFRFGKPNVFMSFIEQTGERVGGRADFRVSDKPAQISSRYPDIAWNGSEFGLVWTDGRTSVNQIFFARVTCLRE